MSLINKNYFLRTYYLNDNGKFPNNDFLPVIHYKRILNLSLFIGGWQIKSLFKKNNWTNSWKDGVYNFLHYHSNTHEVLGICKGNTTILLGSSKGIKAFLEKGDVLIIPAGVAHKNMTPKNSFSCIGAYPGGKDFDMNYGKKEERPQADENIKKVSIPSRDPVLGKLGGLQGYWKK